MSIINTLSDAKELYRFCQDELNFYPTKKEMSDLLDAMDADQDELDFHWDVAGEEYRVIHVNAIDDIMRDELKDYVEDNYIGRGIDLSDLWWIEIDWETTQENVVNADGYGIHFATYDSYEYEHSEWYFFRTN